MKERGLAILVPKMCYIKIVKSLKKTRLIHTRNTAVLSLARLQHKAEAEGINMEL